MPNMIDPMLATLTSPEIVLIGSWIIEPKYDGERIIAVRSGDEISLDKKKYSSVLQIS